MGLIILGLLILGLLYAIGRMSANAISCMSSSEPTEYDYEEESE